jgi:hypothetical protein
VDRRHFLLQTSASLVVALSNIDAYQVTAVVDARSQIEYGVASSVPRGPGDAREMPGRNVHEVFAERRLAPVG